jgi:transcription elongation factor GreA
MSITNHPPIYLTAEGVKDLRRELDHLVNVKRPALAERLRHAIQQGDLTENADYTAAKEEQGFLEGRIQQIETMLLRAKIIEENGPTDKVSLGNRVTVVEDGADDEEVFQIVGPAEARPANGKISYESPLGQTLLGRQVGDTVTVEAPGGEVAFKITDIQ